MVEDMLTDFKRMQQSAAAEALVQLGAKKMDGGGGGARKAGGSKQVALDMKLDGDEKDVYYTSLYQLPPDGTEEDDDDEWYMVSVYRNMNPQTDTKELLRYEHDPYDLYDGYSQTLAEEMKRTFRRLERPFQPPVVLNDFQRSLLRRKPGRVTPEVDTQEQVVRTHKRVEARYPKAYVTALARMQAGAAADAMTSGGGGSS